MTGEEKPLRQLSSVSVVFPAYNDSATIASMVISSINALEQITEDYEIIVTDDGSRDSTGAVLDTLARYVPQLIALHHPENRGYGQALRTGFAACTKDWILYTDGDGQYDPFDFIRLVEAWTPEIDVVNGYKVSRGDTVVRKIVGRVYHHLVRLLFRFNLKDVDCDFRLIRRRALAGIHLESQSGTIALEMVKKLQNAGFRFAEVPIRHFPRPHGSSEFFRFHNLVRTARELLTLYRKIIVGKG